MPKIIITQPLGQSPEDIKRLESLGDLTIYDDIPTSHDEWLDRCQGADIICCGKFGFKQKYDQLKNIFVSLPYVGIGFLDKEILKKNNISVSNSPGCNKSAVAEWIIAMILNLLRDFPTLINVDNLPKTRGAQKITKGLPDKKVCILGKGNIGSRVGKICEALDMKVSYFTRGDNLLESIKDADVVVNCLTTNESTEGLLEKTFFNSFKKGSYFVNVCDYIIYDVDTLISALDDGIIEYAAIDAMGIEVRNTEDPFYQKIMKHPKILATPHIARYSDVSDRVSNEMMVDNIEARVKGKPINLVE